MDSVELIPVDDFDKICRLCLLRHNSLVFLDSEMFENLQNIANIKLSTNEVFPKNICKACKTKIEDFSSFVQICSLNDAILDLSFKAEEDLPMLQEDAIIKVEDIEVSSNIDSSDEKPFIYCSCGKQLDADINFVEHLETEHKEETTKKSRKFSCSICERVLLSSSGLASHMMMHTGDRRYTCSYCPKTFIYRTALVIHTRTHTGERPYLCSKCNKAYHSSSGLKRHVVAHHFQMNENDNNDEEVNTVKDNKETMTVSCKVCSKLVHHNGFGAHMRSHTIEKKDSICMYCNKIFLKKSHLERHIRIHTGERPYTCDICNKTFVQDGDLKRHKLRHTYPQLGKSNFQYQCQVCGKQFVTIGGLNVHLSKHDKSWKGKFKCDICEKTFQQNSHLKQHMNKHTGEKPFLCTVCGKSFSASSSLTIHTRVHTGERPFVCSYCKKGYTKSSRLKQHIMSNHTGEKKHVCIICNKKYSDPRCLKRHRRLHFLVDEEKIIKNECETTES